MDALRAMAQRALEEKAKGNFSWATLAEKVCESVLQEPVDSYNPSDPEPSETAPEPDDVPDPEAEEPPADPLASETPW